MELSNTLKIGGGNELEGFETFREINIYFLNNVYYPKRRLIDQIWLPITGPPIEEDDYRVISQKAVTNQYTTNVTICIFKY